MYKITVDPHNGFDTILSSSTLSNAKPLKSLDTALNSLNQLKISGIDASIELKEGNYNLTSSFFNHLKSSSKNSTPTKIHLLPGAIIHSTTSTALFEDSSDTPISLDITGNGTFNMKQILQTGQSNVTNAPVLLKISHKDSKINFNAENVLSYSQTPINIQNCNNANINITNLSCNGNQQSLLLKGDSVSFSSNKLDGTNTGIQIAANNASISINEINLPNGILNLNDPLSAKNPISLTSSTPKANLKFVNKSIIGKQLIISSDWGAIDFQSDTINLSEEISLTTNQNDNYFKNKHIVDLAPINFKANNINCPLFKLMQQVGKSNINISGTLNLLPPKTSFGAILKDNNPYTPPGGILIISGNSNPATSSSTFFYVNYLIANSTYIGTAYGISTNFPQVEPLHVSGIIQFNVSFSQCPINIIVTRRSPTPVTNPRVNLIGQIWYGNVYVSAQQNGTIDFSVKQTIASLNNGGVFQIFNNQSASYCTGAICIHDSQITNTNTVTSGTYCAIFIPQSTPQYVIVRNSVLSLGIPYNTFNAISPTRLNEPIYPIENITFPPTLQIISYKNIPLVNPTPQSGQATLWVGSNQVDPRINDNVLGI